MSALPVPGQWVRLPGAPNWGIGQVQSVTGSRVVINFVHAGKRLVHAGKRLVHADRVSLIPADPEEEDPNT